MVTNNGSIVKQDLINDLFSYKTTQTKGDHDMHNNNSSHNNKSKSGSSKLPANAVQWHNEVMKNETQCVHIVNNGKKVKGLTKGGVKINVRINITWKMLCASECVCVCK